MPIPRAQELNQHIQFINVKPPFDASSGVGTEDSPLGVFADAWAAIADLGGTVDPIDQETQSQVQDFEIWTRYIDGLTGFHQILWGSRRLVIKGSPQKAIDAQGRPWWTMRAQEQTERSFTT